MIKESMKYLTSLFCVLFLCVSCSYSPRTQAYQEQYAYLETYPTCVESMQETSSFLVILVEARHLDYSDTCTLLRTLAKHPSDGSKNGDVGHAWIYVRGYRQGQCVEVEGGHSGELGLTQARYLEGVINLMECGYSFPSCTTSACYRYEPNPIKYLWEPQRDGYFQRGSGEHAPTFAVKINLTDVQFERIYAFICGEYDFSYYSLTDNQCTSFVTQIAAQADIELEHEMTIKIDPIVSMHGGNLRFWEDPRYQYLTFSSPDILERSMMEAVKEGKAEDALKWYKKRHRPCFKRRMQRRWDTMVKAPARLRRLWEMR